MDNKEKEKRETPIIDGDARPDMPIDPENDKKKQGKRHIPVIALISSKEGRNYLESFGVRADAYMIKPIDAKQFSAAVAHIGIRSVILDNPGN